MLESAFEDGIVLDAAISQSEAHRNAFWFIRDGIVEARKKAPASRTTSRSRLATSLGSSRRRTQNFGAELPGCRPGGFGHVGDGNIHYGVYAPVGMSADDFAKVSKKLDHILLESVAAFDGLFSAEHASAIKESLHAGVSVRNRVGHDA